MRDKSDKDAARFTRFREQLAEMQGLAITWGTRLVDWETPRLPSL